ncbi:Gfo/Idh/MocA family oxidoreductase [Flaviaesturariibacter aridisoli]|uniref:Oxidoreductase n=1 Tax=Flaviaesturariibacter aridisoli TaxID=2545761 RepID=A0A4R4E1R6_9BACT|nr:Gfo/Idh/MocA family oxidoreductase [Flaviaesturariibacter aridisoli]TCZ73434.1 oxidoreductase [Flaviaesturariibacter aridisoli]
MNPIRTALLSFGLSGKVFHAPFLHRHPGFALVAVWERSRKEAESRYPGIRSYASLEHLLEDEHIELVVVNTPNHTHYEYARAALQAGKHVIVEKPFVASVAEGAELLQLAHARGLQLSVYQNRRWDSDFRTAQRVLREGLLGEVVEAAFHFDRYNPALSVKEHKETARPGVGVHYDLGPHIIDAALHLFGLPQSVFASLRRLRAGSQVPDDMDLLLFYPRLRVRLHAGYFVREPLPAFQLFGTEGTFLKARADVQEAALLAGATPGGSGWGLEPEAAQGILYTGAADEAWRRTVPTEPGDYTAYFDGICQALREGAALPVTGAEGLDVIRVLEAAERSAENGCRVPL